MVGGTFSLGLDQQSQSFKVYLFPGAKRFQELQSLRIGLNNHLNLTSILCRRLVTWIINRKSFWWQFNPGRLIQHNLFSLLIRKAVLEWVDRQTAGDGICS